MSEEMTRKEVIWRLKGLLLGQLRTTAKERKALEYAISSLETDEAYQLEYEQTTKENLAVEDCISRSELKRRLQEHHDFFVDAYGGFSNLPPNDKSRVDEITNCIAEVVNMPSVLPKADNSVLENIKAEIESINDWAIRYAPTEDKDKREQVVAKVKKHIISIVDKHISEKER